MPYPSLARLSISSLRVFGSKSPALQLGGGVRADLPTVPASGLPTDLVSLAEEVLQLAGSARQ